MRIPKEIRRMAWPEKPEEIQDQKNIKYHVTAESITADGAEWLTVTFVPNNAGGCAFRYVLSKERGWAVLLNAEGTGPRTTALRKMLCPYWDWPELHMKKQDDETVARWLGTKDKANHYMPALDAWMREDAEKRREARRKANGEIEDGEEHLCPEELPEGIVDYIRRTVLPEDNTLLYKKGNLFGICCLCGAHLTAGQVGTRFRQNEVVKCPACGELLRCVLMNGTSFSSDYVGNIASVQRGLDGETVFIRLWHLKRDNTAEWRDVRGHLREIVRWGIRKNKAVKWEHEHKYNWNMSTWRETLGDWERVKGSVNELPDDRYYFCLPEDWRDQFAGTGLRYCEAGEYDGCDLRPKNMIRFLLDWARYPAIELFWKAGYRRAVNERMMGKEARGAVNWRRRSIRDALAFPTRYLKLMPPGEWDTNKLSRMAELRRLMLGQEGPPGRVRFSDRELLVLVKSDMTLRWLYPALGKAPAEKILAYAEEHGQSLYRDYLEDCRDLRLDLKNRQVLFPKNFPEAHARTAELLAIRKNKVDKEKFAKQSATLERYRYSENGILIRPAATPAELIHEGTALRHCVAGYAERMAKGETAIFLVRREAEPDKPYYTLELQRGKVIQCRTLHNASYMSCPEVLDFVDRWLKFVQKVDRKDKKAAVPAA